MMELTIKEKVYQFNFGMGFLREVNKRMGAPVDGLPDVKKNIGFQYLLAGVFDGDVEALVDLLDAANKAQNPRVSRENLDAYIDDADTNVDALFAEVIDFLGSANATRKKVTEMMEAIEQAKAKQEATA